MSGEAPEVISEKIDRPQESLKINKACREVRMRIRSDAPLNSLQAFCFDFLFRADPHMQQENKKRE